MQIACAANLTNQDGVDGDTNHNEKALQAQGHKAAQVVVAHLAPFPVGHGGKGDRANGAIDIDFHHAPHQHQHDAQGQDGGGDAQEHGFHQQAKQLANPHRLQLGRNIPQGGGKVHAGTAGDNAGTLLYDVLCHIKDGHGDVKGVCDQIDRHERFENPLEDIKGVKVVEVVLFDNHGNQFIAQDKGDDDARNGHHHRLAQALYHGEDPGVPCRRGLSHTRRHVPDLLVDLVKQPVEIAHNAIPQDSLDPILDCVEDVQHQLHPALSEQVCQQRDELHPNQRDTAPGHQLFHTLAFCARVIITITFQKVDHAPHAQASAQSDYKDLQGVNGRTEKFHIEMPPFTK